MTEDVVLDPTQVSVFGFDAVKLDANQFANSSNCDMAAEAVDR
jgi:hypothetical protein